MNLKNDLGDKDYTLHLKPREVLALRFAIKTVHKDDRWITEFNSADRQSLLTALTKLDSIYQAIQRGKK